MAGWLAGWCCSSNGKKEGNEMKGKERKGREKVKVASWRNASVSSVAAAGLSIGTLIHN
jgi:hypothetical protein